VRTLNPQAALRKALTTPLGVLTARGRLRGERDECGAGGKVHLVRSGVAPAHPAIPSARTPTCRWKIKIEEQDYDNL
jgi:hypothetical protein